MVLLCPFYRFGSSEKLANTNRRGHIELVGLFAQKLVKEKRTRALHGIHTLPNPTEGGAAQGTNKANKAALATPEPTGAGKALSSEEIPQGSRAAPPERIPLGFGRDFPRRAASRPATPSLPSTGSLRNFTA